MPPVALDLPGPSRRIRVEPLRSPVPDGPPPPAEPARRDPEPSPAPARDPSPEREPVPA